MAPRNRRGFSLIIEERMDTTYYCGCLEEFSAQAKEIEKIVEELQSKIAQTPIASDELSEKLEVIRKSLSDLTESIDNDIDWNLDSVNPH